MASLRFTMAQDRDLPLMRDGTVRVALPWARSVKDVLCEACETHIAEVVAFNEEAYTLRVWCVCCSANFDHAMRLYP